MGIVVRRFVAAVFPIAAFIVTTAAVVLLPVTASAQSGGQPVPRHMLFAPEIRASIGEMLANSPTFRAQFQRVAESASIILTARLDPTIAARAFKARSRIRRYDTGLLVVNIEIGPGAHEPAWIAHEFEHIVEQLEGLDLLSLARHRTPGVWFSGEEMVETSRATRAGQAVMAEMRGHRQSDNLVQ